VVPTAITRWAAADPGAGVGRDGAPLGVHRVIVQIRGLDGLEGAGADMQGHAGARDAASFERLEQGGGEVEARGGGGDRTGGARRAVGVVVGRVDGLVAVEVVGAVLVHPGVASRVADVGGERGVPDAFEEVRRGRVRVRFVPRRDEPRPGLGLVALEELETDG
jgi:hypothetical protein